MAARDPEARSRSAATTPPSFGDALDDLAWIDEFAASVRPHVRVRREDSVMIKIPTEVFPLNRTGLGLLERVLSGEPARRVAVEAGAREHPERVREIHAFFCDLRDLLSGRFGDGSGRRAVRRSRFKGSFTRYPVLAELALTYGCNLACRFCYAGCGTPGARPGLPGREKHRRRPPWRRPARAPRNGTAREGAKGPIAAAGEPPRDLDTAEARRVIDTLALEARVPSLSFTGGECTLRRDLPELVGHARERDLRVNIITNGVRCASPRYAAELHDAGLHSAQVSLEGPSAEVHDRLTRRPGSFERAVRGVRHLQERSIHVHIHTTIQRANAEHLGAIVDLARSLALPHVSMNMLIPVGTPAGSGRGGRTDLGYREIGEHVLRARERAERVGIGFHWYSPTPFCLFNPVAHGLGNKGCAACDGLIHVSPRGDVLPCSSFSRGVGNLLRQSFEEVWFGADARYYKEKRMAPLLCRGCEHFALCQGACTLYWSSRGTGELLRARLDRLASRLVPRGARAASGARAKARSHATATPKAKNAEASHVGLVPRP